MISHLWSPKKWDNQFLYCLRHSLYNAFLYQSQQMKSPGIRQCFEISSLFYSSNLSRNIEIIAQNKALIVFHGKVALWGLKYWHLERCHLQAILLFKHISLVCFSKSLNLHVKSLWELIKLFFSDSFCIIS